MPPFASIQDIKMNQSAPKERKPRADALRNRERILEEAKRAFTRGGGDISLEDVARQAGVGPGTLYRHFPTRDALLESVYRAEVAKLAQEERRLSDSLAPPDALRSWMLLFIDYIATKRMIAPSLGPLTGRSSALYATSAELITGAISTLVKRAVAGGDVRKDIAPSDLLRAMVGVSYQNPDAGWEASARRVIDLLMDGLRRVKP